MSRERVLLLLRVGVLALEIFSLPSAVSWLRSGLAWTGSRDRAFLVLRAGAIIAEVLSSPSAVFSLAAPRLVGEADEGLSWTRSRVRVPLVFRTCVAVVDEVLALPSAPGSEIADLSGPLKDTSDRSLRVAGELGSWDTDEFSTTANDGSRRGVGAHGEEEEVPIGLRSKLRRFSNPVRLPPRCCCCAGGVAGMTTSPT